MISTIGGGEVKRNGAREVIKLINETIQTMEERGFLQEDVEHFIKWFSRRIKENEETIKRKQPFRVYKDVND